MAQELMPVAPFRPSVVVKDGWRVIVGVHDQWFRARVKALKQDVLDCHPDRRKFTKKGVLSMSSADRIVDVKFVKSPDSTRAFLIAQAHLEKFLKREEAFYKSLGLKPPEV